MEKRGFEEFTVYKDENSHSFIYADFNNKDELINGLIDYLFDESNLLNYANSSSKVLLDEDNPRYWVKLYKNISYFLNEELEKCSIGDVSEELITVLGEEYTLINENGELVVQKDKIGKIGEYAFHILMSKYFGLSCILPKFRCTTDRNMSVFGIDALFMDINSKCLYFGESKFSINLQNGIKLANKSISDYEQQIREEYRIVLSSEDAFALSDDFKNMFLTETELCINFDTFIKMAKLKEIAVPVFVAHGNKSNSDTPEGFVDMMKTKISTPQFFGIATKYIFISLPVIDKAEFIERAIKKVVIKQHEFESRL